MTAGSLREIPYHKGVGGGYFYALLEVTNESDQSQMYTKQAT